jgi:hypothetical protein
MAQSPEVARDELDMVGPIKVEEPDSSETRFLSAVQPILIEDFSQENLSAEDHLDNSPILYRDYHGNFVKDRDKTLADFVHLCKNLKQKEAKKRQEEAEQRQREDPEEGREETEEEKTGRIEREKIERKKAEEEKRDLQRAFAYLLDSVDGDSETDIERKRMFLCFNLLKLRPGLVSHIEDVTFILNHVAQKNRAWLKTCIIQALRNRAEDLQMQAQIIERNTLENALQDKGVGESQAALLDKFKLQKSKIIEFFKLCGFKTQGLTLEDKKEELQVAFVHLLNSVDGDSETEVESKRLFLCINLLKLQPGLVSNRNDITFILNHVMPKDRALLKICIIQAIRDRLTDLKQAQNAVNPEDEKQIELKELVGELQSSLGDLQDIGRELQRRHIKAESLELEFERSLLKFKEQIQKLEALNMQLNIKNDQGLPYDLNKFALRLSEHLSVLKGQPSKYTKHPELPDFVPIKTQLAKHKKSGTHDSLLDAAYITSELANIGLVLQEVVGAAFGQYWIELGMQVGHYTNPMIYALKAIQRGMKLIGRKMGLEFAEDEVGISPRQSMWDGISAGLFIVVAVLLSVGAAIGFPMLETAAWLIAPVALGVVWSSEYGYQNERASDRLKNMKMSEGLFNEAAQAETKRVAFHKKVASVALAGVIIFITLGMLAASIAGIPFLDQIPNLFTAITVIAGAALATLALARGINFFIERKAKDFISGFKEFWSHPGQSLKAFGSALWEGLVSLPGKVKDWFAELGSKIKDYFTGLSRWQKVALVFSVASLALSISVLSGGIVPLIGLAVAGACSAISMILKGYDAYNKRLQEKSAPEAEKVQPFKDSAACSTALNVIAEANTIAPIPEPLDSQAAVHDEAPLHGNKRDAKPDITTVVGGIKIKEDYIPIPAKKDDKDDFLAEKTKFLAARHDSRSDLASSTDASGNGSGPEDDGMEREAGNLAPACDNARQLS